MFVESRKQTKQTKRAGNKKGVPQRKSSPEGAVWQSLLGRLRIRRKLALPHDSLQSFGEHLLVLLLRRRDSKLVAGALLLDALCDHLPFDWRAANCSAVVLGGRVRLLNLHLEELDVVGEPLGLADTVLALLGEGSPAATKGRLSVLVSKLLDDSLVGRVLFAEGNKQPVLCLALRGLSAVSTPLERGLVILHLALGVRARLPASVFVRIVAERTSLCGSESRRHGGRNAALKSVRVGMIVGEPVLAVIQIWRRAGRILSHVSTLIHDVVMK